MNTEIFRRDQAERYAPKTPDEVERAAKDLAASGYSDHTVASILHVDVTAVRRMIGERSAA